MNVPWKRKDLDDLARELRASRPEPPAELMTNLEHELAESSGNAKRQRRPKPSLRFGLAAGMTAILLGSLAAAGGLAAASSSVRNAFTDVARVAHISAPAHPSASGANATPATDQYARKKSCVKAAKARENAAIRAANRALAARLAAIERQYKAAVAAAKKRYLQSAKAKNDFAKEKAAIAAAAALRKKLRAAAFLAHKNAVNAARARYRADVKKCPIVK